MGCDVHVYVEVKINGQWCSYAHPNVDRDYELFGVLAGVRRDGPPIVEPRGVPDDLGEVARMKYESWGYDAHTPSWFGPDEMLKLSVWWVENGHLGRTHLMGIEDSWKCYLFGEPLTPAGLLEAAQRHQGLEDFRVVFWFDN